MEHDQDGDVSTLEAGTQLAATLPAATSATGSSEANVRITSKRTAFKAATGTSEAPEKPAEVAGQVAAGSKVGLTKRQSRDQGCRVKQWVVSRQQARGTRPNSGR